MFAARPANPRSITIADIVFGSEFDQARYLEVVRGCALLADIKTLPDGDATEIGERGV